MRKDTRAVLVTTGANVHWRENMVRGATAIVSAILLVVFVSAGASADWDQTYGGGHDDFADSIRQTTDGGYIVAGGTYSFGGGLGDAVLMKTNAVGDLQWSKFYGDEKEDWAHSVWQTRDNAYIVAGFTESYGAAGSADVWLLRIGENGEVRWTKTFGSDQPDHAFGVQQTADGGYIITGDTSSYGAGSADIWLIKTDTYGNEEWDRTFGGEAEEGSYAVQQTSDGGYIVAGFTSSYSSTPDAPDAWVIKTDAEGNEMWSRVFGGSKSDWASSVQQTSDGGYIVGGYTGSFGAGQGDIWLIRLDADGNELWNKTFGGPEEERSYCVRQASNGGYIVSGYTWSYGAGEYDIWLIKTSPEGEKEWERFFGGERKDKCKAVIEANDGDYVLAGNTQSFGDDGFDIWLIKAYPSPTLTRIELVSPETDSSFLSPPTFSWTSDGGADNAYAVDLSYSSKFNDYWSSYDDLNERIYETHWTLPEEVWKEISPKRRVYWRVRGADLTHQPLEPITSVETRLFYKE